MRLPASPQRTASSVDEQSRTRVSTALLLVFFFALFFTEATPAAQPERGEYLARHVAMCVQCHSPRDAQGRLIEQELFLGAPIPVLAQGKDWALRAPRIARLPGWTGEDFVRLLRTGKKPDGSSPRRPMPPFRMTEQDAAAIEAYLRSLGTAR